MDFLHELEQLRLRTPRLYNINIGSENSDYCTHSDKNKNCYLVFAANFDEDCMYGGIVMNSRDCVDCNYCEYDELCYECTDTHHCYNCAYGQNLKNCSDCAFCYDCIGCRNCFGCAGLRQKEYCYFNEQLSKEEYRARMASFDFKDKKAVAYAAAKLEELKQKIPHLASRINQSENCTGEFIEKSKNCIACFDVYTCEDCMYMQDCWRTKDSMEMTFSDGSELCYECFSIGLGAYNCNFSTYIRSCSDCEYCELCFNCKHCFGCIGLQNKEFYILNKPYLRDEYFKYVSEIKSAMRSNVTYGKHLPTTYKYEDTAAVYWK